MNKDVWSYFKHFWEIAGKNLSVPHSQQDWWRGSQPARCTFNLQPDLLGSFLADEGHRAKFIPSRGGGRGLIGIWVWLKCYIHPFSRGWGRGRAKRFLTHSAQQLAPQTPTIFQFPRTYYFVQISQPAKICLKNRYFEEQIHWVPLSGELSRVLSRVFER